MFDPRILWIRLTITSASSATIIPMIAYTKVDLALSSFFSSPDEVTILMPEIIMKINASTPATAISTFTTIVARAPKSAKAAAGGKTPAMSKA